MQGFSLPAIPIVDTVVPNPKLKLLDQIREVMRLKHYSIRTEQTYADWVRRYVHFHQMRTREEMLPAEPKIEAFLSELAVKGNVGRTFVPSRSCWAIITCHAKSQPCRRATLGGRGR